MKFKGSVDQMLNQEPQRNLEAGPHTQLDHYQSFRRQSHPSGLTLGSGSSPAAATGAHLDGRRSILSRLGSSGLSFRPMLAPATCVQR